MRLRNLLLVSLMLPALAVSSIANATPAAATPDTLVQADNTDFGPGSYDFQENTTDLTVSLSGAVPGSSTYAATNASIPSVTTSGYSETQANGYVTDSQSSANLTYYYDVTGTGKTVPIDISYYLSASSTVSGAPDGAVGADAEIDVYRFLIGQGLAFQGANIAENNQTFKETFYTSFLPDETFGEINIAATETSIGDGMTSSTTYAFADPHIYIDPTFLAANPGAKLEISSGISNLGPSAAPEPAAWALMMAGIGAIGLTLRRVKVKTGVPVKDTFAA